MKEYCYEIFYQYDGPSLSDLFATKKTDDEVQDALNAFSNELPHYIEALNTSSISGPVEGKKDRRKVIIKTTADEHEVTSAVVKCLQSLDLRGTQLN